MISAIHVVANELRVAVRLNDTAENVSPLLRCFLNGAVGSVYKLLTP